MTRQMIEITFGNAMSQARQIDDCADDMMRVANRSMNSIKGDISAAWQGSSASNYLSKMDMTAANIRTTANKLYQIAETIRTVARIFRDTEIRALEIAQQRTY